jgi:hypothetical protein
MMNNPLGKPGIVGKGSGNNPAMFAPLAVPRGAPKIPKIRVFSALTLPVSIVLIALAAAFTAVNGALVSAWTVVNAAWTGLTSATDAMFWPNKFKVGSSPLGTAGIAATTI